jgi:O-antigen/teichoic acid export membrane protein
MCNKNAGKLINNLFKPRQNLTHRAAVGGFWVFALRFIQQGFNFIRLIVVAQILTPNDFGLMGIALLTMATLDTLSQTGRRQSLIQKKGDIDVYLNSAWTLMVIRGLVIFAALVFIAPYVADFFKSPSSKSIVQVIGVSILIQGFTNIGVIYFEKDLAFNKQFIYELSGTLSDFVVSVVAAYILGNVWALLLGLIAGNAIRCIVSYMMHPFTPHFSADFGKIKELWGFGRWIFSSGILIFLITQGDDIFVGKYLGVTVLGLYQIAYAVSNTPATEISHVISRVTFPAYSKLQGDINILKEAYLKILQLTLWLSLPLAGLIIVLGPDFTKLFLGEKWMPMVPSMQILSVYGAIRAFGGTAGSLFQGVGKPAILTRLAIIDLAIMIIIIYPLTTKYGIVGTSIAVLIPVVITNVITIFAVLNIIRCDSARFANHLLPPLISTIILILPLYLFTNLCHCISFYIFAILIFYSVVGYIGILYVFKKNHVMFDILNSVGIKDFKN